MKNLQSTIEYPENSEIPIWRYMSFTKFMDLISTNSIFFSRADKFEDNFEGYINKAHQNKISEEFKKYQSSLVMKKNLEFLYEKSKESTLISCWNMNETDSLGMWKSYCSENEGITIKSSIKRLMSGIIGSENDNFHIKPVKYLDVEKTKKFNFNVVELYTSKRIQFKFENELRIIMPMSYSNENEIDFENGKSDLILKPYKFGKSVKIDFSQLVDEIIISPKANEWFVKLVERIVNLNYNIPIRKSEIYKLPK